MAPGCRRVDSQILRRAHPVPGGAELVVGEQADDRRNVAGPARRETTADESSQ